MIEDVRPLYKDLLCSTRKQSLIDLDMLTSSEVTSFFGDIVIRTSGKKNEWHFWEHRLYERRTICVELFFMGQITANAVNYFFDWIKCSTKSLPTVVYMSFSPPQLPDQNDSCDENILLALMHRLKSSLPLNTMIILGSGFDSVRDFFGSPCFDHIPFLLKNIASDENHYKMMQREALSLDFHYLYVSHYHQKDVFRGITVYPGWQSVVVRYTTCLILTYVALNLSLRQPRIVSPETLRKAIAVTQADNEVYRRLLLRQPCDWQGAKSICTVGPNGDPAAENASELICILWKQSRKTPRRQSMKPGRNDILQSRRRVMEKLVVPDDNSSDFSTEYSDRSSADGSNEPAIGSKSNATSLCSNSQEKTGEAQRVDDGDDLEEGEIRESSPDQYPINVLEPHDDVSDIDSLESSYGEDNEEGDVNFLEATQSTDFYLQTVSEQCNTNIPEQYVAGSSSLGNGVIEISDDDASRDGILVGNPALTESAAFQVSSQESDVYSLEENVNNQHQARNSSNPKPIARQNQTKTSDRRNAGLVLVDRKGVTVPWPIDVAAQGVEKLWRWWKTYLLDNKGCLTIRHPGGHDIHAMTPLLNIPRCSNLVIPKIIDDLHVFLRILDELPLDANLIDTTTRDTEDQTLAEATNCTTSRQFPSPKLQEKIELASEPQPKIRFALNQRGIGSNAPQNAMPAGKIRVRSFASIGNFSKLNQVRKKNSAYEETQIPACPLQHSKKLKLMTSRPLIQPNSSENTPSEGPLQLRTTAGPSARIVRQKSRKNSALWAGGLLNEFSSRVGSSGTINQMQDGRTRSRSPPRAYY